MARIVAQAVSGVDPKWIMEAPIYAVEKCSKRRVGPRRRILEKTSSN